MDRFDFRTGRRRNFKFHAMCFTHNRNKSIDTCGKIGHRRREQSEGRVTFWSWGCADFFVYRVSIFSLARARRASRLGVPTSVSPNHFCAVCFVSRVGA